MHEVEKKISEVNPTAAMTKNNRISLKSVCHVCGAKKIQIHIHGRSQKGWNSETDQKSVHFRLRKYRRRKEALDKRRRRPKQLVRSRGIAGWYSGSRGQRSGPSPNWYRQTI